MRLMSNNPWNKLSFCVLLCCLFSTTPAISSISVSSSGTNPEVENHGGELGYIKVEWMRSDHHGRQEERRRIIREQHLASAVELHRRGDIGKGQERRNLYLWPLTFLEHFWAVHNAHWARLPEFGQFTAPPALNLDHYHDDNLQLPGILLWHVLIGAVIAISILWQG